jgi:hypothetical protein
MQPVANLGGAGETRPRSRKQSVMPSHYEKLLRKDQLLARLDPEHEIELDGTFIDHLTAAIRASSPSKYQKALDKATEAYENALDEVLYVDGGILSRKAELDVSAGRRIRKEVGCRWPSKTSWRTNTR